MTAKEETKGEKSQRVKLGIDLDLEWISLRCSKIKSPNSTTQHNTTPEQDRERKRNENPSLISLFHFLLQLKSRLNSMKEHAHH
ncbi:hypothetical protein VNO77_25375 [Canavalia gladiata]|uniref:Uncharacterized protein n=1 Tax=Canavalia gladiata TaxID=3824 RepID=A0AAN9QH17_CANGL